MLKHFVNLVNLGRLLFPRYFFYAVFSTALLIAYLIVFFKGLSVESVFAITFGSMASAIFWYEAFRIWSLKPD